MSDYALKFEQRDPTGKPTKVWYQARSQYKDLRRGAEKALGPLTGRQWKKARRRMLAHTKPPAARVRRSVPRQTPPVAYPLKGCNV